MTAQGQEIMNRLAILPETNYGDFRFKHSHSGFCTYEPLICVKPGMILED